MAPFRLAIFECDTPIDPIRERSGTYGDICASILAAALKDVPTKTAIEPVFTSWDVVDKQEYPNLEQVDGILLTGSSKFLAWEILPVQNIFSCTSDNTRRLKNTTPLPTIHGFYDWSTLSEQRTKPPKSP